MIASAPVSCVRVRMMAPSSYSSDRPWWRSHENPRDPGLRPSESFAPIAAAMPRNCQPQLSNGNRYRARAEDCRAIAQRLIDPKRRQQMLDLAETYEKAATFLDRL